MNSETSITIMHFTFICLYKRKQCADHLLDHKSASFISFAGGVLNFELATDVRPEVSNTTL